MKYYKTTALVIMLIFVIAVSIMTIPGLNKQTESKNPNCFPCNQMSNELNSAILFLNWYNNVSNDSIALENMSCVEICNTHYKDVSEYQDYHKVVFSYNGKNITVGGNGYLDSEDQISQSKYDSHGFRQYGWWFEDNDFCFAPEDCTGITITYSPNSSWKDSGTRGACFNKYLMKYDTVGASISVKGYLLPGSDGWNISGTVEYPISKEEPIVWGTYNCDCRYSIPDLPYLQHKVCSIGMRIS